MPSLHVLLFACATSYALAVDLRVMPTDREMPPRMTPEEADRAIAALSALGLSSRLACPLAEQLSNKMVTLADGYTYDLNHVLASCRNADTLKSPHYQHLTIPTILAVAFVNLDLMDIVKNAEMIEQSVSGGEIPVTVRRWIGSPLPQPIWICADGRSRLMTSFKRPFTIEQLGMFLALDNGEFCFRNIRLEQVVDEICRRVDCGRGWAQRIRGTSVRMDTAHVEPDAQSLSISNLLSPSTAASSSRPSVANPHRQSIDTSSTGTSTAVHSPLNIAAHSPTSTARSSNGRSPVSNHQQSNALVSPFRIDDIVSAAWANIADAIPWPSESEMQPAPSLPSEISSAWAATIAYTRALHKQSFWDRDQLCSSSNSNFYAALFWADHYCKSTPFKPADMELPPKPTNSGDMRGWQAGCLRFFQAAEDIVVNSIIEKQRKPNAVAPGHYSRPVCRHARALQRMVTRMGLVPSKKRKSTTWSDDTADTIPWPGASKIKPPPSLPYSISSAWAATIAYTRSLDDRKEWQWEGLTETDANAIYDALFWVRQYTTEWEPPGMSLPPKPASSGGFREWQASCYRFFKAAEDRVVESISEKQKDVADDAKGSARIIRFSDPLRRRLRNSGLPINAERKRRKLMKRS